jgi:hypothetical protein
VFRICCKNSYKIEKILHVHSNEHENVSLPSTILICCFLHFGEYCLLLPLLLNVLNLYVCIFLGCYGKQSINLNKVVATFEKHIFLSQTDLTRTGIISNSYNEMFEV